MATTMPTIDALEGGIAQLGIDALRQATALLCIRHIVEEHEGKLRVATKSNDMAKVRECIDEFVAKLRAQLGLSGIPCNAPEAPETSPMVLDYDEVFDIKPDIR